ncbi:MAG: 2-oxoglutarate oxidoreductase [Candidatus Tectomicrobia bacterium]|uniref:2-oxoglutarate oxidoreductase n=1 Tax=Tectimicrobiota bacterium TaxID=2528274 RepID=A0A933LQF8_UNCTE|nr:2-oxoglutarate oxidoreductase [Candidatus Tectomicrobia bacterium]
MTKDQHEKIWVSGSPKMWRRHPAGSRQCSGCHQPLVERIIADVVEELDIAGDTIIVTGVGCSSRMALPIQVDSVLSPHGRAPDVATGIKRMLKGRPIVMTLQGDGDCASIGAGSLINAAMRSEKITVVMLNNTNYGMTGGQLSPTSLMEQTTTTTPTGRSEEFGYPAHIPELLVAVKGVSYAARSSVHNPAEYQKTKRYLKNALTTQINRLGLSFLEIIVACPSDWHMTPIEALDFIKENILSEFPLGEFKKASSL